MAVQPIRVTLATIAASASLSGPVYVGHGMIVGIQMPAAWDAADLTFQASADGVTYNDVYDFQGNEVDVKTAASRYVTLDEPKIGPWIKIRSGTTGSHVNQTLDSILSVVMQSMPNPSL